MTRALTVFLLLLACAVPATARAGGSEWSNFAPYADDVAKVVEQLKWDVLRSGDYFKRHPKRKPKSPKEAVEMGAEEGTHSIMDIGKVSQLEAGRFACKFATVCPMPRADLVKLFGTDKPTRAMAEDLGKRLTLATFQPRWSGVWIKLYEGATPKWLFFVGVSGD